jgi:hypothetical protein
MMNKHDLYAISSVIQVNIQEGPKITFIPGKGEPLATSITSTFSYVYHINGYIMIVFFIIVW